MILNDAKGKILKQKEPLEHSTALEVVLETITQIKVQNEVNLLEPLLSMVTILSGKVS